MTASLAVDRDTAAHNATSPTGASLALPPLAGGVRAYSALCTPSAFVAALFPSAEAEAAVAAHVAATKELPLLSGSKEALSENNGGGLEAASSAAKSASGSTVVDAEVVAAPANAASDSSATAKSSDATTADAADAEAATAATAATAEAEAEAVAASGCIIVDPAAAAPLLLAAPALHRPVKQYHLIIQDTVADPSLTAPHVLRRLQATLAPGAAIIRRVPLLPAHCKAGKNSHQRDSSNGGDNAAAAAAATAATAGSRDLTKGDAARASASGLTSSENQSQSTSGSNADASGRTEDSQYASAEHGVVEDSDDFPAFTAVDCESPAQVAAAWAGVFCHVYWAQASADAVVLVATDAPVFSDGKGFPVPEERAVDRAVLWWENGWMPTEVLETADRFTPFTNVQEMEEGMSCDAEMFPADQDLRDDL